MLMPSCGGALCHCHCHLCHCHLSSGHGAAAGRAEEEVTSRTAGWQNLTFPVWVRPSLLPSGVPLCQKRDPRGTALFRCNPCSTSEFGRGAERCAIVPTLTGGSAGPEFCQFRPV